MEHISTEYLKQVLFFDDSDLAANRLGNFSWQQRKSVPATRLRTRGDSPWAIFILGSAFLGILVFSWALAVQQGVIRSDSAAQNICMNLEGEESCFDFSGTKICVGIGVVIALFFAVGGLIGIVRPRVAVPTQVHPASVKKAEDYAVVGKAGDGADLHYYVEVGKKQIIVSQHDYQALQGNLPVRVILYYASDTGKILSAEVVE